MVSSVKCAYNITQLITTLLAYVKAALLRFYLLIINFSRHSYINIFVYLIQLWL